MQQLYKFLIIISLTLVTTLSSADRSFTFGIENFEWTEPSLKLTEEGSRYFVGMSTGNLLSFANGYLHEYSGSIYKGTIDYKGTLQNGTPYNTETKYSGLKGEVKLVYRDNKIDYVGAIGIEKWSRDIGNGDSRGYEEEYTQPYIKLGLGYLHQTGAAKGRFEAGIKRPFNITEKVERFNIELEPEGANSIYLQYRYQSNKKWGVTVYSEKTLFEESDIVRTSNGGGVRQPESKADALGAKIHYRF